jgi:hypothetical protein
VQIDTVVYFQVAGPIGDDECLCERFAQYLLPIHPADPLARASASVARGGSGAALEQAGDE